MAKKKYALSPEEFQARRSEYASRCLASILSGQDLKTVNDSANRGNFVFQSIKMADTLLDELGYFLDMTGITEVHKRNEIEIEGFTHSLSAGMENVVDVTQVDFHNDPGNYTHKEYDYKSGMSKKKKAS